MTNEIYFTTVNVYKCNLVFAVNFYEGLQVGNHLRHTSRFGFTDVQFDTYVFL